MTKRPASQEIKVKEKNCSIKTTENNPIECGSKFSGIRAIFNCESECFEDYCLNERKLKIKKTTKTKR